VWWLRPLTVVWPFVVCGLVVSFSWGALRQITTRDFRTALGALEPAWLIAAALATLANVGVMGLYDVIAFRHTRSRAFERWRYGAVAFAWSNFLTLGPLAGPAIRFWLYQSSVDHLSELSGGVASVSMAFVAGLAGWVAAAWLLSWLHGGLVITAVCAFAITFVVIVAIRLLASQMSQQGGNIDLISLAGLAGVGWLDWFLAAVAFSACVRATGVALPSLGLATSFFLGQAVGLLSFVPGGFGSSDVFWIAHLGLAKSAAAAALMVYRLIYYIAPWAVASLVLLSWVSTRTPRRLEFARRVVAGLVGGGGVLIMLSSASPALHARLVLLHHFIPLPLVEAGQATAALAGLVLVVLARGLDRGYRAAFSGTRILLALAGFAAILKGFDWEESMVLGAVAIVVSSQAALFDRPSEGDWLEGPDLVLLFGALALFIIFGTVAYHVGPATLERWSRIGYRFQATRFVRTAASMVFTVIAATVYVFVRTPLGFTRLANREIDQALDAHKRIGGRTSPLLVATGDKAVFYGDDQSFCLYRTIGPYLVIFSDPVVGPAHAERAAFLDAFFAFARTVDRRPVFYQISLDWIPLLHDRGYEFFKLGEQADIHLDRITLEGHAGKLYRQILRRAERDGVRFRIADPREMGALMPELASISAEWLGSKKLAERQFSIGFFDEAYLRRYRCALVEEARPGGRILGFANLFEGPHLRELSVDLMRYRSDGPQVMDFLLTSLFLEGKALGYKQFDLGMAPLSSVGDRRGARWPERLGRVIFQRGEQWYNFQGLRRYKEKFHPEWVPRYMAYQNVWEWPLAIAYVSALIAGGWSSILLPASRTTPAAEPSSAPQPQLAEI
jgi:phosphatidylglycerol lysyltransferase